MRGDHAFVRLIAGLQASYPTPPRSKRKQTHAGRCAAARDAARTVSIGRRRFFDLM